MPGFRPDSSIDALTAEILVHTRSGRLPAKTIAMLIDECPLTHGEFGVLDREPEGVLRRIDALIEAGLLFVGTDQLVHRIQREIERCTDPLEKLSRPLPGVGVICPSERGRAILQRILPPCYYLSSYVDHAARVGYYWQLEPVDRMAKCFWTDDDPDGRRYCDCETARSCRITPCGPWWSTWWQRHETGWLIECRTEFLDVESPA